MPHQQLLDQYEPLVHKVLSRMNIKVYYRDYEDFAQELRLELLAAYDRFQGDPFEANKYEFTAYAGRALRWRVTRLLRQQAKSDLPSESLDFIEDRPQEEKEVQKTQLKLFLEEAKCRLNYKEWLLVHLAQEPDMGLSELADLVGLSRQKVRDLFCNIRKQLFPYKSLLYDN